MNRTIGKVPSGRGLAESFKKGIVDICPAPCGHSFEELGCPLDGRPRLADGPLGERIHGLIVEDYVERLAFVEPGKDLQRGLAYLNQLFTPHAARSVDDERDLALERRAPLVRPRRQARKEQEVTASDLRIGVREQRRRDLPALAEERQPERAGLGRRAVFQFQGRDRRRRPPRREPVARRVNRRERRVR